jgi:hypothetical protein
MSFLFLYSISCGCGWFCRWIKTYVVGRCRKIVTSVTSATLVTIARCNNQRTELTSIINHRQILKSVTIFIQPLIDWLRAGPGMVKNFLFSTSSRAALGSTQPPIEWVPGALFPGESFPGREADYSPPTSAEVKKMWLYISTPPYAFMA